MSWIQKLCETYDNCQVNIGYADQGNQRPLLPICHITAQAHIEIVLNSNGNFRRARIITEKADSTTIIPCTESSGSRAGSKPECHPLCDKLQYIAGDFTEYGGAVTSGFSKDPEKPYYSYIETLTKWCTSEFAHPKAKVVLAYVQKKEVIRNLVDYQILYVDSNKKLLNKNDIRREKNAKDIFSVIERQDNAFIRWIVEDPNELESRIWRDKTLWESWIQYYLSNKNEHSICYVTGKEQSTTNNHPKYVRREGDGAKLISANDTSGFTFRGRFLTDQQACGVGLETSHKAHYALSWLISRQGYRKGDIAIVAWATSGTPIPQPTDDTMTILGGNDLPIDVPTSVFTAQETAIRFRNKIAGYGNTLGKTSNVVVMALDSATPGRLSITYYRELTSSDFLQRIEDWHKHCAWQHNYRFVQMLDSKTGKVLPKRIFFIGAPAPIDIAEAAFGERADDKLKTATVERILPCIIDGQPIPRDLLETLVRRASNRIGLRKPQDKYETEWNKCLSITCALFKKYKQGKENFEMPLDETRTTRDYLYGRLLAIADCLEETALYKSNQKRPTNAARYMLQFSQRPFRTWKQIHDALTPYVLRLNGAYYYKKLIGEVESLFNPEDFILDKPLTGEYLLGYYCQRQALLPKKQESSQEEDTDNEKLDQ